MSIISYKNRQLDMDRPIQVYRNINKRGVWYSIRQDGKVKAHATSVKLKLAFFKVSQAGRERMLLSGHKNVHAWVEGFIVNRINHSLDTRVSYKPTIMGQFIIEDTRTPIYFSEFAKLNEHGLFINLWLMTVRFMS